MIRSPFRFLSPFKTNVFFLPLRLILASCFSPLLPLHFILPLFPSSSPSSSPSNPFIESSDESYFSVLNILSLLEWTWEWTPLPLLSGFATLLHPFFLLPSNCKSISWSRIRGGKCSLSSSTSPSSSHQKFPHFESGKTRRVELSPLILSHFKLLFILRANFAFLSVPVSPSLSSSNHWWFCPSSITRALSFLILFWTVLFLPQSFLEVPPFGTKILFWIGSHEGTILFPLPFPRSH